MESEQRRADTTHRVPRALKRHFQGKVLDIGPGGTGVAEALSSQGFEYVGMDISAPAIQKLKQEGFQAVLGDARKKWPFQSSTFDTVYISHVLEHFLPVEQQHILEEAHRVLKKKGRIIATTPSTANIFFWSEWTHVRPHDHNSLSCMLEDCKFVNVEWVYPRAWFIPKTLQRHLSKLPVHGSFQEVSAWGTVEK